MVSIKTGSNVLTEKAKGIPWLLNGGGREEVEEGLKGPWRMEPRLWEAGTPPGWGLTPPRVSWLSSCCPPALHHPSFIAKPARPSPACQGWGFKGDFYFSPSVV